MQDGDVIGFGGPDTIIARRVQVANPFLFKFYGSQEAVDAAAAEELYSYSTHEDHATGAAKPGGCSLVRYAASKLLASPT